jgi:hypothetical protein
MMPSRGIRPLKYHLEKTRPNGTLTISGATILDVGGCSDTAAVSQSRGAGAQSFHRRWHPDENDYALALGNAVGSQ